MLQTYYPKPSRKLFLPFTYPIVLGGFVRVNMCNNLLDYYRCRCWAGAVPSVCRKGQQCFVPLAASPKRDDLFLTRVAGDFEDEILYHFDGNGKILETVSLGARRMTFVPLSSKVRSPIERAMDLWVLP